MTSSSSERDRASGSSDEDCGNKKALHDHTLHEVRDTIVAGKTPMLTVMSAPRIVVADGLKRSVCVEPSVLYTVDTGDVENGSEGDESEAIILVELSNFEQVASEMPSLAALKDEQNERLLDLSWY